MATVYHLGTVGEGAGGAGAVAVRACTPESCPAVACTPNSILEKRVCTEVEAKGAWHQLGLLPSVGRPLALCASVCISKAGACHTTPEGDQRTGGLRNQNSKGVAHKMTARISHPGFVGLGV